MVPETTPALFAQPDDMLPKGKRVVFVCDASGTMIDKFPALKRMLAASVADLKPEQTFNVVFFQDGSRFVQFSPHALPADASGRQALEAFLKRTSTFGTTDPIPALEAAFKQAPDVVCLVTDGDFNNLRSNQDVADAIARLNPGRRVRVDTVLLDGYEYSAAEFLQLVATENGGHYTSARSGETSALKVKP